MVDEFTIAEEKTTKRKNGKITKHEKKQYAKDNNGKYAIKLCAFSPYKMGRKTKMQALLAFNGEVQNAADNSCSTILVYTGCEELVISKAYAEKMKLRKENTNQGSEVWGQIHVLMGRWCENLILRVGEATISVRPYVVVWIAYDLILGKAWLSESNALIDWKMIRVA